VRNRWPTQTNQKQNDMTPTNETTGGPAIPSTTLFADAVRDAEQWGSALNEASWEMIDAYREHIGEVESVKFFNNGKTMLRRCILAFLARVEKNNSANRYSDKGGLS